MSASSVIICQIKYGSSGIQQLATRSMDDALRSFEGVLAEKPTNVIALLGKVRKQTFTLISISNLFQARILYARRQYLPALKLFQLVLSYNPRCLPDPRIGIGLCFWAMDHKMQAKAAWERSLEVVCTLGPQCTLEADNPSYSEPRRMASTTLTWPRGDQREQNRRVNGRRDGPCVPQRHEAHRKSFQCKSEKCGCS